MKKTLRTIGWIAGIFLLLAAISWFGYLRPEPPPISPGDRIQITLMPLPAEMRLAKGNLELNEQLHHTFTSLSSPRLERAMDRFYTKLSTQTGLSFGQGTEQILFLDCDGRAMDYPMPDDDESYSLKISPKKMVVKAHSETGIIYALESLLQLVREQEGAWTLPALTIHDEPRYPWRGLMIDACRHWIPKDVILRNLEAMGTLKMNVFHWHLSEYQGFRVESKRFPGLHEQGSGGDFYTQEEIRELIEFAADRGIRVVPEFDLPGHSTSWFVAYPELASAPGPYVLDTIFGILDPVMDPSRKEVYAFLDRFFEEMSDLFPDPYIHIGGDEVHPAHWKENAEIQNFAKEKGLEDARAIQAYFNRQLQDLLSAHGKRMMGWDEIIHPDLPEEEIVVQTWRDHSSLWESARKGHQAVLSAGYYLDYKQPAGYHYQVDPEVIPGAVDIQIDTLNWKSWDCSLHMRDMHMEGSIYLFGEESELRGILDFMGGTMGFEHASLSGDQLAFAMESNFGTLSFETLLEGDSITGHGKLSLFTLQLQGIRSGGSDMPEGKVLPEFRTLDPLTSEEKRNLIGGEACMWSEMVDGQTIESRIWPRAAAVGEKLWSPGVLTSETGDMYRRLMHMDERLEQLGLKHRSYNHTILRDLAPAEYQKALRILTSLLQEDRFFARMEIYDPQLYTTTPLTRMVDAAPSESFVAYRFAQDVENWISTQDSSARERMVNSLEAWSEIHRSLEPAFENNPWLEEVREHAIHLSELAELGLRTLHDPDSVEVRWEDMESLFASAKTSHGGTILAVVDPVQKLVSSASGK